MPARNPDHSTETHRQIVGLRQYGRNFRPNGCGVFCMLGAAEQVRNPATINPRLLPAIDQLLIAGIKLGPNKKHEAINKILKLVPEWKRGDCGAAFDSCAEHLRSPVMPSRCKECKKQRRLEITAHRIAPLTRPWLPEDDATLLDLAGYEPVDRLPSVWVAPSAPSASGWGRSG